MRSAQTELRSSILESVTLSKVPLSAKHLHESFSSTDLSTLYRALSWLEKEGQIESVTLSCSECGLTRYYRARNPHCHYFHCEVCHSFYPLEGCAVAHMQKKLSKEQGFDITGHVLYFTGSCKKCRDKTSAGKGHTYLGLKK